MNLYESIIVAKYALADVVSALRSCGITKIAVTKEDNELVVRYQPIEKNTSNVVKYFATTKKDEDD